MAEVGSLLFQVETNVVDSEEEEEEILRKQELQKLLSEELQDDLLDTSEEEEEDENQDEDVSFESQGYQDPPQFIQPPSHYTEDYYGPPPPKDSYGPPPPIDSYGPLPPIDSYGPPPPKDSYGPPPPIDSYGPPPPIDSYGPPPPKDKFITSHEPILPRNAHPQMLITTTNEFGNGSNALPTLVTMDGLSQTSACGKEESNVFNGTSQEYSTESKVKVNVGTVSPTSAVQQLTVDDNFFTEFSHLDRQHLEALYVAKNRRVKELELEVKRVIREDERKFGVLRHQLQLLEEEKQNLLGENNQLSSELEVLRVRVSEYEGQEEEKSRIEQEREELSEQLSSAQTTISMLTSQLNEMSNTDVLQKIRQNYESALSVSNVEHERQTEELKNRILSLEGELEEKVLSYDQLIRERESQRNDYSSDHTTTCLEKEGEREREDEKRRLIAEIEDLTFQLNTIQDELSTEQDKVVQLQQALNDSEESQQARLKERMDEEERVKSALEKLQSELSNQKIIAEANLKSSLEHCRSACLKLHEDSTLKLKEEFLAEKERTESHYRAEINKLRQNIGRDKEKSRREREESLQKQVDAALLTAHNAWKEDEEKRLHMHVQNIMKQMTKDHERKLADALKKKEIEWSKKTQQLAGDAECSRQKNEREISQLNKKLAEAFSSKIDAGGGKLVDELKSILKSLQAALIELMSQTLIHFEEEKTRQIKAARQIALKEAETHYLSCLHTLVNSKYSSRLSTAEQ